MRFHAALHSNLPHLSDYDCFYASVFEAENPALKALPLAVQQKQIVVTCNYEARRRGLRKLQLIKEAKKTCPEVVIVLGEDLTKFRDISKGLYSFLSSLVWGDQVEKLGFDEVFLDVTSMIEYNLQWLEPDITNSVFQLDKDDFTVGFEYDPTVYCGPTYPSRDDHLQPEHISLPLDLGQRLILASHLGNYLRKQLEERHGYTSTVGISTSKLLAKLAGNVHKPRNQTTLIPPFLNDTDQSDSYIIQFMDSHEIGKVPGIGFKIASLIRAAVLGRENDLELYRELRTCDQVTVGDVRTFPGMGPLMLDKILSGGGWPKDIGTRIWGLINGVDHSEVAAARATPTQISIEDSFRQLDTLDAVRKEILPLARNLIRRMHTDLTEEEEEMAGTDEEEADTMRDDTQDQPAVPPQPSTRKRRWLAHPRTLRLSTRSRIPPSSTDTNPSTAQPPDRTPTLYNNRISRSCPIPQFIFSFKDNVDAIAERLVHECLMPAFLKLHPEKSGWRISLINVAVTNMVDSAGSTKNSAGRDIGKMFRSQSRVLREWKVADVDNGVGDCQVDNSDAIKSDTALELEDDSMENDMWEHEEVDSSMDNSTYGAECHICGTYIPHFALKAHETYHSIPD
ncbi:DNA polymerase iota [Arthroderma uncinatum]|uniref:DNA polymerase iota n=1 Tax=Arthroderma uncinatum TaxID=74035 RepID=UPI00144AE347|nr:DNA polymerase iota [Arthroderma uncinatum]KAF3481356.1 DNA polymerase iota [Arthroderma uncinatum]